MRACVGFCVIASAVVLAQIAVAVAAGADWNAELPMSRGADSGTAISQDYSTLERMTPFRMTVAFVDEGAATEFVSLSETPETNLDLALHGFRIDGDAATSIAVISAASGAQKEYSVGDEIEGVSEVYLMRILADGVIIERQQQNEWLPLNTASSTERIISVGGTGRPSGLKVEAPERASPAGDTALGNGAEAEEVAGATADRPVRQEAESKRVILSRSDAETLVLSLRADENTGDVQKGFSIFPTRNVDLFGRAGFAAGDVVVSVDGSDLDGTRDLAATFEDFAQRNEVALQLVRGDRIIDLVIVIQ